MGDKLAKSKNLCCHLVVFTRYSLLSDDEPFFAIPLLSLVAIRPNPIYASVKKKSCTLPYQSLHSMYIVCMYNIYNMYYFQYTICNSKCF